MSLNQHNNLAYPGCLKLPKKWPNFGLHISFIMVHLRLHSKIQPPRLLVKYSTLSAYCYPQPLSDITAVASEWGDAVAASFKFRAHCFSLLCAQVAHSRPKDSSPTFASTILSSVWVVVSSRLYAPCYQWLVERAPCLPVIQPQKWRQSLVVCTSEHLLPGWWFLGGGLDLDLLLVIVTLLWGRGVRLV